MPKIDLEEIQQRINQNLPLPNEPQPSARNYENPSHPIWELWQRMGEIYGHQWASQQGDEPNDTWCKGLADITPQQFGVGLRALLIRTDTWPPNLVEFRQLCTGHDPDGWQRKAEREQPYRPALENKTKKERDLEDRKAALAKLREEVGL